MPRMMVTAALVWLFAGAANAADLESYAIVNKDATLDIRGRTVRLFGIYIPESGQQCGKVSRPARCYSRAAFALDFKIQRFVRCRELGRNSDNTVSAVCWVNYSHFDDGEDLGAYLIDKGLAVATPSAPFEYHVRERIARENDRGVWGFQVDSITRR